MSPWQIMILVSVCWGFLVIGLGWPVLTDRGARIRLEREEAEARRDAALAALRWSQSQEMLSMAETGRRVQELGAKAQELQAQQAINAAVVKKINDLGAVRHPVAVREFPVLPVEQLAPIIKKLGLGGPIN